ncbi:MAG: UbiX family flavin prenyltransferase [Nitrososphaerales archaeon]
MRIVVGIAGASGAVYAVRLLEVLREIRDIETHVTMTGSALKNLQLELNYGLKDIKKIANKVYDNEDVGAAIASGSFPANGMVVVPCSMKALAGISTGFTDNLLLRSADVTIKEGRRMVIVPRETPLSIIHLENMLKLAKIPNITVLPAMPAFYHKPKNMDGLVNHIVGKILDQMAIEWPKALFDRWGI